MEPLDWKAGEAMQDKETMFVLYVVSEGLCSRMADFRTHFEGVDESRIRELVAAGFLSETGGLLEVTERGRLVLGDLAKRP